MTPRKIKLTASRNADLNPGANWLRDYRRWWSSFRTALKRKWRGQPIDRFEAAINRAAKAKNWKATQAIAADAAQQAEATSDRALLLRAGYDMRRLRNYDKSFELIATSDASNGPKEWDGCDLRTKVLLIERRQGDLATFFLYVGVIELAMRHCRKCIVLIDERLVSLFRRTFPGLDLRVEHRDEASALADADAVTSFEMVAFRLKWDLRQARTLKPDPLLVQEFRDAYRLALGDRKLIGVAWGSLNRNKSAPLVRDWRRLMAGAAGQFVSLQYGKIDSAIASFERLANVRVFVDKTVDQLADMDRFAAQVASLDAVITTSNTIAHAAGALGPTTVVLLDDRFAASWPALGDDVPWYPGIRLVRKSGRSWATTVDEARGLLAGFL